MGDSIRVVVGLGNPGPRYASTRHNIGFRLVDLLAGGRGAEAGPEPEEEDYCLAWTGEGDHRIALLKPTTYMNLSGRAVSRFGDRFAVEPGDHLVVLDDVSLPFGSIRFRGRGGAGGHRGLESVIEHLGTEEVPRLRLGVGDGGEDQDLAEYVLEPFSEGEEKALSPWLEEAAEAVRVYLTDGLEVAMNRFNRWSAPGGQEPGPAR